MILARVQFQQQHGLDPFQTIIVLNLTEFHEHIEVINKENWALKK